MDEVDRLLTIDEAAAILRRPTTTLRSWRHRGTGPKAFRIGGRVMYRASVVYAFVRDCEEADDDNI